MGMFLEGTQQKGKVMKAVIYPSFPFPAFLSFLWLGLLLSPLPAHNYTIMTAVCNAYQKLKYIVHRQRHGLLLWHHCSYFLSSNYRIIIVMVVIGQCHFLLVTVEGRRHQGVCVQSYCYWWFCTLWPHYYKLNTTTEISHMIHNCVRGWGTLTYHPEYRSSPKNPYISHNATQ